MMNGKNGTKALSLLLVAASLAACSSPALPTGNNASQTAPTESASAVAAREVT